jgi:hypothetical protein
LPEKVVLYDFMVLLYAPDAEIVALTFDLCWINAPNCAAMPVVASVRVTELTVGTTELGTFAVSSTVLVPIVVLPFFVMQRMVTVPLVALGMLFARLSGTVQDLEVVTPVAMLTYEPPAKA